MKPSNPHPEWGKTQSRSCLTHAGLWILAAGYFVWLAVTPPVTSRWVDFPVYWDAGLKATEGRTVFDVAGHFQYKYSPLIALLFGKLFQFASFLTASWIFQKAMLLLWFSVVARALGLRPWAIVLWILFFGNALRLDLALGQANALVFFLLLLLFSDLERPSRLVRDVGYGVIFSLAVQLKLFAGIVVLLLIFRRQWRKLFLGLALLPVLSIGGVAIEQGWTFALSENVAWLASLADSTDELLVSSQNVGVLGFFARNASSLGLSLGWAKAAWLLVGAGFLYYLWTERNRPAIWLRNRLLFAISAFNPLVWSYWILFAFPLADEAARGIATVLRNSRTRRFQTIAAVAWVFLAFNGQHARWAWQGGILVGLILIFTFSIRNKEARAWAH